MKMVYVGTIRDLRAWLLVLRVIEGDRSLIEIIARREEEKSAPGYQSQKLRFMRSVGTGQALQKTHGPVGKRHKKISRRSGD